MGKKNKNRQKKESPWKDIPVTTYEELHPKLNRTPEEKAALQVRKKKVNDSLALQRMARSGPAYKPSHTTKRKKPKNVQIVPIQKLVEVGVDKETGEKVFAKVKTNKTRVIVHGANNNRNATKPKRDTGELVPDPVQRDILAIREADRPDPGAVPEDTGAKTGESVQSIPTDPTK